MRGSTLCFPGKRTWPSIPVPALAAWVYVVSVTLHGRGVLLSDVSQGFLFFLTGTTFSYKVSCSSNCVASCPASLSTPSLCICKRLPASIPHRIESSALPFKFKTWKTIALIRLNQTSYFHNGRQSGRGVGFTASTPRKIIRPPHGRTFNCTVSTDYSGSLRRSTGRDSVRATCRGPISYSPAYQHSCTSCKTCFSSCHDTYDHLKLDRRTD
jgi:hypothetical protein